MYAVKQNQMFIDHRYLQTNLKIVRSQNCNNKCFINDAIEIIYIYN